jgi:hypothetical protein
MDESFPRIRLPFKVDRSDDFAVISMDCGRLIRARIMPCVLLKEVGDLCRFLQEEVRAIMVKEPEVPIFPGFVRLLRAGIPGVCIASVGAHRLEGRFELVIALYDGDESAPFLILVEEEIEEFIKQTE